MTVSHKGVSYADAGVDIDAGNDLVKRIKPAAKATHRSGVMDELGGFGALFDLKATGYRDPILVSATDGVGTKLRIAIDTNHLHDIGIDLVAMCVNDLICQGAEPLFFLDYYATGKLSVPKATAVIEGIARGCKQAGCALIGGETAEMPGMYAADDFDLAGFALGAMERGAHLPQNVGVGDKLIALRSDGPHATGFSLIRHIVAQEGLSWTDPAPWEASKTLGSALLVPTRLYVHPARQAMAAGGIHALAHITGGGVTENLPRILPKGLGAQIDLGTFKLPPVFRWLMDTGGLSLHEMLKTFNCGIGLIAVVAPQQAETLMEVLREAGEDSWCIGDIIPQEGIDYIGSLD